jgi:hypothetical protein
LEEDEKVKLLDQQEEKIGATMQKLNQRHKSMRITKFLKSKWEIKTLQEDLKTVQINKKERQAQLECLQEKET